MSDLVALNIANIVTDAAQMSHTSMGHGLFHVWSFSIAAHRLPYLSFADYGLDLQDKQSELLSGKTIRDCQDTPTFLRYDYFRQHLQIWRSPDAYTDNVRNDIHYVNYQHSPSINHGNNRRACIVINPYRKTIHYKFHHHRTRKYPLSDYDAKFLKHYYQNPNTLRVNHEMLDSAIKYQAHRFQGKKLQDDEAGYRYIQKFIETTDYTKQGASENIFLVECLIKRLTVISGHSLEHMPAHLRSYWDTLHYFYLPGHQLTLSNLYHPISSPSFNIHHKQQLQQMIRDWYQGNHHEGIYQNFYRLGNRNGKLLIWDAKMIVRADLIGALDQYSIQEPDDVQVNQDLDSLVQYINDDYIERNKANHR